MNHSILEAMTSFFIHIIAWVLCIGVFAVLLGIVFLLLTFIWDFFVAIVSIFYPKAKKLKFDAIKRMGPVPMC